MHVHLCNPLNLSAGSHMLRNQSRFGRSATMTSQCHALLPPCETTGSTQLPRLALYSQAMCHPSRRRWSSLALATCGLL